MTPHANSKASSGRTRALFGGLAVGAVLIALWLLRAKPERASLASTATSRPTATRVEPALEAQAQARAHVDSAAPQMESEPSEALVPPPVELELAEKAWITLRVVDERRSPVGGAVVTHVWTHCLHARDGGESSTAAIETVPEHSGVDGLIRLAYPVRHARDCVVNELGLAVHHPDFAPFEAHSRPINEELEVVLTRGEVLVLSGWIGSPDQVINEFDAQFSDEVELAESDWLPRRDGRRTTTRVPLGSHLVKLRHWNPDGVWWSALSEFEVVAGLATEVHLELRRAVRLRGRLGYEVPRPVIDGRVAIAFARRNPTNEASSGFYSRFSRTIAADGTFEVDFLPPEQAQFIAICRGWVVRPEQASSEEMHAVDEHPVDDEPRYPALDLRSVVDEVIVAMEPTATLEVRAVDSQGAPVAGVGVDMFPNVCWEGVGCAGIAFEFGWHATTDATGFARIESVPSGSHSYRVHHARFRLPAGRWSSGQFASGETLKQTLTLELIEEQ